MIKVIDFNGSDEILLEMASLYNFVWNAMDDEFKERIKRHSGYEGFRAVVALNEASAVVGFAYGYVSSEGQFYRGLLEKALSHEEIENWLEDCFEFVELAVHPEYQRNGLGVKLHQKLLAGIVQNTSILTTQVTNVSARSLYLKLDWVVVKEPFIPFSDNDEGYVIMGKVLG